MAIWKIDYTIMGSGTLEVEADSAEQAVEMANNTPTQTLIDGADFKRGFTIVEVMDENGDTWMEV